DLMSHAEWRNTIMTAPPVTPGDSIVIEWDEMFSMGNGDVRSAKYDGLTAGNYRFRARGLDILGNPCGPEASGDISVALPFLKTFWFWGASLTLIFILVLTAARYLMWKKVQREMLRLKNEQALERERLRIARDIHDDLGTRVTQISLLSAMSQQDPTFPKRART